MSMAIIIKVNYLLRVNDADIKTKHLDINNYDNKS